MMPQELKKRIIFTFLMICLYRFGTYVPVPGISASTVSKIMSDQGVKDIFGIANVFSGGAIERISIFSLSMMPYITASIVVQLMSTISNYFKSLKEEGVSGRRKLNQITRYLTIALAFIQGLAVHFAIISKNSSLIHEVSPSFSALITCASLISGAIVLMWLGEKISFSGIGNGISVLVLVGIISSIPSIAFQAFSFLKSGFYSFFTVFKIAAVSFGMLLLVCFVEKTYRMIKINYPVSVTKGGGRDSFSFLPLKVNISGVIPPIFASSVVMFVSATVQFFNINNPTLLSALSRGGVFYVIIYSFLIVFFSYFYSSVVFDHKEIAINLKKTGCFLSGIRPGESTANFISLVISKLVIIGSVYLVFVCTVPELLISSGGVDFYIGGTGVLIIVNVASDIASQIRSHFVNQKYGLIRVRRKKMARAI